MSEIRSMLNFSVKKTRPKHRSVLNFTASVSNTMPQDTALAAFLFSIYSYGNKLGKVGQPLGPCDLLIFVIYIDNPTM